jgi:predicted AlkP superfamily phosphohydrolase/phosphomutase
VKKVFVLGIDGANPEFVFTKWIQYLPNLRSLMKKGVYAKLRSTIPPLTAVAWTSMTTGKSPAEHGLFEYVYRKNKSYTDINVISNSDVKAKRVWEVLSDNDIKSVACLVPITWPVKPFDGVCVSGFLTPGTDKDYTYPKDVKKEIDGLFQEPFIIDIYDHRKLSKKELLDRCYKMTEMHFKLMEELVKEKEWEFFFGVIVATDWVNHSFFRFADELHRHFEEDSEFRNALRDYYIFVDKKLGELLSLLSEDTLIMVVSDHGMTRMHNRFNLSDWLIKEGYLKLKKDLSEKTRLTMDLIDWDKTKAWAIGAYEGQIFINLKGREPKGIVENSEYEELVSELRQKLSEVRGDEGSILNTHFFTKDLDFNGSNNQNAPDLMVYFDNLQYGCNNSFVKNSSMFNIETAKGGDDSGHSREGIFIMNSSSRKGFIGCVDILDVTPTILNNLGVEISGFQGKVIS